MNLPASKLQRILNNAPIPFRLGDYISQGFQFMNRNFGMLLAFMLLSTMISFIMQVMPVGGMVLGVLIAPVLQIGYAQFAYAVTQERRAEFGEFFKGFNKIGPLISTYFLTALIGLAAMVPGLIFWYKAGMLDWFSGLMEEYPFFTNIPDLFDSVDTTLFGLGILAILIGALSITVLFAWALNIVWFFEVGPLEALSASRKLIGRNWLPFVSFIFVAGIIAGLGILLCGVGVLYTAPAMACAQFFAFADATRLFEDGEDDQSNTIDHFIV